MDQIQELSFATERDLCVDSGRMQPLGPLLQENTAEGWNVIASESARDVSRHANSSLLESTTNNRTPTTWGLSFCRLIFFFLPKRKLKNAFQLPLLFVCVCVCEGGACVYTSRNSV
jgi:hypothetical protein